MKLRRLLFVTLCTIPFLSCQDEASEEELIKIRKFTSSAYTDLESWRVPKDTLDKDYTDMSKALDVPVSSFERVQDMIEELPKNQQEEFIRVEKTLDSLNKLDAEYSQLSD